MATRTHRKTWTTESRELQEFTLFHLKPRYTLHEPATVQMGHAGHSQWKTSAVHQSVPQIHQRHPSPAIDWEWHWKYRAKQLALESGLHGPSSSWPQQFWGRYKTLQNYRGDSEETCVIMKSSRFFWPSQYLRIWWKVPGFNCASSQSSGCWGFRSSKELASKRMKIR